MSSTDLFVVPGGSTSNVLVTGRMAIGESRPVTIGTAGKQAMLLFDGTAGQKVSLSISDVTCTGWNLNVYNPYNSNNGRLL